MNLGLENKKKAMWAAILGGVLVIVVVWQLWGVFSTTPAPRPPAAPVVTTTSVTDTHTPAAAPMPAGTPVEPVVHGAGQLDPTLHPEGMMEAESLLYAGSGRNIFSMQSAPPPIPKAIAPPRPNPAAVAAAIAAAGPPPPPPPPPIDLKFFGTESRPNGNKRAFLLHGEDVFLAGPGDIVDRRYRVDAILPNGIVVEDLPNNNKQTLPLLQ